MDHNHLRPLHPHPTSDMNYFSEQAMRVGLIGGDTREPPMMNSDPFRDELQRELEKQRIRDEIIYSEMMRKRDLEAEVRRELAIERDLALQRGDGFPPMGQPSAWSDHRHALVNSPIFPPLDQRHPKLEGPKRSGFGLVEKPKGVAAGPAKRSAVVPAKPKVESQTLLSQHIPESEAEPEELPFQRNPQAAKIVENNKLLLAAKPKPITANLAGTKRKTTEDVKKPQDWTCTLCKVSATCERSLNMHYQGKKHKTNEEKLKKDTGKNTHNSSLGKKNIQNKKKEKRLQKQAKRMLMAPCLRKRRFAFWCEDCQIGCHTEQVMVHHVNGKKHLTKVEELKQTAAGSTTSTVKDESNVKQEDESEVGKETSDVKMRNMEVESAGQEVATESMDLLDKVVEAEQPETEEVKSEPVEEEEVTKSASSVGKGAEAEQPESKEANSEQVGQESTDSVGKVSVAEQPETEDAKSTGGNE